MLMFSLIGRSCSKTTNNMLFPRILVWTLLWAALSAKAVIVDTDDSIRHGACDLECVPRWAREEGRTPGFSRLQEVFAVTPYAIYLPRDEGKMMAQLSDQQRNLKGWLDSEYVLVRAFTVSKIFENATEQDKATHFGADHFLAQILNASGWAKDEEPESIVNTSNGIAAWRNLGMERCIEIKERNKRKRNLQLQEPYLDAAARRARDRKDRHLFRPQKRRALLALGSSQHGVKRRWEEDSIIGKNARPCSWPY
ncbi:unnamed protein product [Amoebophrya sp. A25]|nr:unnamed protein product [Amoebophrya sp. A25]|eukprot:GSA25T00019559001.1